MKDDETSLALRLYELMAEQDSIESADTSKILNESLWIDGHFSLVLIAREIIKANEE